MLGDFSQFFRIFRACWAHLTPSCYFVTISDDLLLISDGFWQVRGAILGCSKTLFASFWHACALVWSKCSACDKTTVLVGRSTLRKQRAQCHKS